MTLVVTGDSIEGEDVEVVVVVTVVVVVKEEEEEEEEVAAVVAVGAVVAVEEEEEDEEEEEVTSIDGKEKEEKEGVPLLDSINFLGSEREERARVDAPGRPLATEILFIPYKNDLAA